MTGAFGDGIPIPDIIDPPESMSMTLCIPKNRDHMAAFFGALYQLTIWNSWQQNNTTAGKELAAVWWRYYLSWDRNMNDIECEDGMSNCCTEPAIIKRINPTTGNVEQSTNGGVTWTPAAGGIQSVIVQPVPPVTSGVAANKCDAAANVAGQVDVWINQVSVDFTTAVSLTEFAIAVLEAILIAVLAILTEGALTPLEALVLPTIGAAVGAAYTGGKAAFDAYWTTDIKHKILCAAFCNIGEDGSFTDAQFSAFWNKINADLPPAPSKMLFMGFLSSVGMAGLNAMAASGTSSGADCSSCQCVPGCDNDWSVYVQSGDHFGVILEQTPTYIIAQTTNVNTNGTYYIFLVTPDLNACCYINSMEVLEGSNTQFFAGFCGAAIGTVTTILSGEGCFNQLQPQSNAPFKVKFNLDACP